jgi:hypothetical protein
MNERRERGLSTADLAGAEQRKTDDQHMSPKYVEGEETTEMPRAATTKSSAGATPRAESTPLFPAGELDGYRSRWSQIQGSFVDEPRRTVEQADGLVAEVIKRLAQVFADERGKLEGQWGKGGEADTEDLRVALQRYRSFFERLLSA